MCLAAVSLPDMYDKKLAAILAERPDWQSKSRPRLAATLVMSALLISSPPGKIDDTVGVDSNLLAELR